MNDYRGMTLFSMPRGSFKFMCLLSIPGNQVQYVMAFVVMASVIHPNVLRLLGCRAPVM